MNRISLIFDDAMLDQLHRQMFHEHPNKLVGFPAFPLLTTPLHF
jgi:hypothetical protein